MIKQYHCTYEHCDTGWGEIKSTTEGICPFCDQEVKPESIKIIWIYNGKIVETEEIA